MDLKQISSSSLPTNSQSLSLITNCQDYYLIHENIIYKIVIAKNIYEIFIKCKSYAYIFNPEDLSILYNMKFNSIDEAYDYIIDIFEQNNAVINSINTKKDIKLLLKGISISLKYNIENSKITENNNDYIINEFTQLRNEITELKEENRKLKEEINNLKKFHVNSNPKDIKLMSDVANDSFGYTDLDNSFVVFKAINNIVYIVYSTINKAIVCYDLNKQKIKKKIESSHNKFITNFRHYFEKINRLDLIMSISSEDNNIKVWNFNNWETVLNINNANYVGYLYSACFFNDDNKNFIITSNRNKQGICESIKIFDFNGYVTKEINNSKEQTYYLDTYYDDILLKKYIITGNVGYVKSYDYEKNDVYHIYNDNNYDSNSASFCHFSVAMKNDNGKVKLIESCFDGNIRIWNFHSALLLFRIKISDQGLRGICLWNNNYLFIGCDDKTIKLIEIKNGLIVKCLDGHTNEVITVKKIIHPIYGECLVSQNGGESHIKFWINQNLNNKLFK